MADDKDKKPDSENLTPEEKLFRAVVSDAGDFDDFEEEEQYQEEEGGFVGFVKNALGKVGGLFSKGSSAYKEKSDASTLLGTEDEPSWIKKSIEAIKLRNINRTVGIIVILVGIYLCLDIILGVGRPLKSLTSSEEAEMSNALSLLPDRAPDPAKPLNYYLDPTQERNVFTRWEPPPPPPSATATEPAVAPPPVVEEVPVNLKLVGISWDEEAYVAMIEVEAEGRARFVKQGDKMPGGIQVAKVEETTVYLKRGAQEWELS